MRERLAEQRNIGETVMRSGKDHGRRKILEMLLADNDGARDNQPVEHIKREGHKSQVAPPGIRPVGYLIELYLTFDRMLALSQRFHLIKVGRFGEQAMDLLDRHLQDQVTIAHRFAGLLLQA